MLSSVPVVVIASTVLFMGDVNSGSVLLLSNGRFSADFFRPRKTGALNFCADL